MKIRFLLPILLLPGIVSPVMSQTPSIEELQKKVAETTRLKFLRPVPVLYMTKQALTGYIDRLVDESYPAELAAREAAYGAMIGFFDSAIPLLPLRKKIILDNVGGLYNEKSGELVALEEFRQIDMFNQLTLVHELRHALQDQHVRLRSLVGDYSDYDDRSLAVLAALEGDATLLMVQHMGLDADLLTNAFQPENIFSFAALPGVSSLVQAPDLVKYQLLMPYLDGLRFSSAIHRKKRWPGLNRVMRAPPKSSEQILHPEKYLRGEAPLPVSISYQPSGWSLRHEGVVGEYFLNVLLKTAEELADVAEGWGGDRFKLYERSGSRLLVWKSLWDTEAAASRFSADFGRFVGRRFRVNLQPGNVEGRRFLAAAGESGYYFLQRRGVRIFFVRSDSREEMNHLINGGIYD